jgi:hypothetical protein
MSSPGGDSCCRNVKSDADSKSAGSESKQSGNVGSSSCKCSTNSQCCKKEGGVGGCSKGGSCCKKS